jgi:colanic acid biosynthesis glycosyl transferase WcaI
MDTAPAEDRRPAVVLINRVYPPFAGATGRLAADLARGFARAGWAATVVTTGPQAGTAVEHGVTVIRARGAQRPGGPPGYARAWWALSRAARRVPRADVVVSMTDPPLAVCIGDAAARRLGAAHLHWCQDVYPALFEALDYPVPGPALALMRRWTRGALARAARVVTIGRCMAGQLVRRYDVPPARITLIPNWPDMALSPRRAQNTPAPAPHLKAGPPCFRVLYAGTLGRAHDAGPLLAAARRLAASHPEVAFTFAGSGPGFAAVEAARAAGAANITLLPPQPEGRLRALMESGDVHLVSLRARALGLSMPCKVYSAFAVGRPCVFVGPERAEAARVIADHGAGAVIDPGDADGAALAAQIVRYCQDADAWFAAQAGAVRAGRVFTPRAAIRAFIGRARGAAGAGRGGLHCP